MSISASMQTKLIEFYEMLNQKCDRNACLHIAMGLKVELFQANSEIDLLKAIINAQQPPTRAPTVVLPLDQTQQQSPQQLSPTPALILRATELDGAFETEFHGDTGAYERQYRRFCGPIYEMLRHSINSGVDFSLPGSIDNTKVLNVALALHETYRDAHPHDSMQLQAPTQKSISRYYARHNGNRLYRMKKKLFVDPPLPVPISEDHDDQVMQ